MSSEEKISNIEKDVNAIKRWWPVLTACGAILFAVVSVAISLTSTYDNKVAKKDDITALSQQIKNVGDQVSEINSDFKEYKISMAHQRNNDSLGQEKIKKDLLDHIRLANIQYKDMLNKFKQITYHEQYYYDKNGKRNVSVIQN